MKTHQGCKKRFFVTESGKVMCMPQGKQHLNYGTSGRKRQKLRQKVRVYPGQEKEIRRLLMRDRRPLNPRTPGASKKRLILVSAKPPTTEAA
jgi:ribosomal protein L35